jgi:flavin-dependent thymidylate synthase
MAKAKLSGINKDLDSKINSPESIVAANARISRSPYSISELRKDALETIEKSRKSNQQIVFGLGHGSVSEHAVTNWDITDISRLAVEWIEKGRYNSYTEKSQRYVKFDDIIMIPEEIFPNDRNKFENLVVKQNKCYDDLTKQDVPKEDARYILPLVTQTQLGMTLNARSLEKMILEGRNHNLKEIRNLAEQMYDQAKEFIPSLISHADEDTHAQYPFMEKCQCDSRIALNNLSLKNKLTSDDFFNELEDVNLVNYNNIDQIILSTLLFKGCNIPLLNAKKVYDNLGEKEKIEFFKDYFKNLSKYEKMPREFELGNLVFNLVVSASNYAQLKRHRPGHTLISSFYDPRLGHVTPKTINDPQFQDMIKETNHVYSYFKNKYGQEIGQYLLTNAHKRIVTSAINMREFYHFSRLREDGHAQWEIREMAHEMVEKVKKIAPITSLLLGGKDKYDEIKEVLYK